MESGDAVHFNPHIFHMCPDNSSSQLGKAFYIFGDSWMKNYPSAIPRDLSRIATTHQRKQLFGLYCGSSGDYFDQSLEKPGYESAVERFAPDTSKSSLQPHPGTRKPCQPCARRCKLGYEGSFPIPGSSN